MEVDLGKRLLETNAIALQICERLGLRHDRLWQLPWCELDGAIAKEMTQVEGWYDEQTSFEIDYAVTESDDGFWLNLWYDDDCRRCFVKDADEAIDVVKRFAADGEYRTSLPAKLIDWWRE